MRLADAAVPGFARHETFHPRYGWFRKAYSVAAKDPHVFTRGDAPVQVGVGKNMTRAIRFWGLAAKLLVEDPEPPRPRSPGVIPTRIGHAIFGESGWDPYMEDPGTLWLLHWLLLAPPSRLPVWWLVFNEFSAVEFTEGDLEHAVEAQLEAVPTWSTPHPSSRKKDINALLRTYGPPIRAARTSLEDLLDCPLRELGLIHRSAATGRYRFTLGPKPTLPPQVAAYAVFDYISRTSTSGTTITVSRLAHESCTPGRVFKLTESELLEVLEPALQESDSVGLVRPTGATQLTWIGDAAVIAVEFLNAYYNADQDVRAGCEGDEPVDEGLLDYLGMGRSPIDALRVLHRPAAVAGGR